MDPPPIEDMPISPAPQTGNEKGKEQRALDVFLPVMISWHQQGLSASVKWQMVNYLNDFELHRFRCQSLCEWMTMLACQGP